MGLLFCLPAFIQTAHAGSYEDFFSAIEQDKPEVIQKLLNRGFDPNTVNPKGVPGLLLATQKKSLAMLRVLSQAKGVDLNIQPSIRKQLDAGGHPKSIGTGATAD